MYRERNRIERTIVHLKINRAIATRYDRSHRRSEPTCNLAHGHTLFQELHGAKAPPLQHVLWPSGRLTAAAL